MKIISFKKKLLVILFFVFISLPIITTAQTLPADPAGDPDLPIDGGVSLLIAAGVGYGIKKYRDERKKSSQKAQ